MNYQQGGWYDNPATGQNQQYWNGSFLPKGMTNNSPGIAGGNGSGGSPSGSSSSNGGAGTTDWQTQVQNYISPVEKAFTDANNEYQSGLSAYDKAHPFNFDDMLAKEVTNVTPYVSKYYTQQLGNFMQGVEMTRAHSIQDTQRQVGLLQADMDAYTGQAQAQLKTALIQAGQQYSDAGSYDSGVRMRNQGIQEANTQYDIAQNQRTANYNIQSAQIANQRLIGQTIPYETNVENQQINRNQTSDIQNLANQNYNYDYALNQYNRQNAGIANIGANGNYQAAGALPGQSSAQTHQFLSGLLPNVTASPVAPIYQTQPGTASAYSSG